MAGELWVVVLYHSPVPTQESEEQRLMMAVDIPFKTEEDHDAYFENFGSLPQVCAELPTPPLAFTDSMKRRMASIVPFCGGKQAVCSVADCNRRATSLKLSEGGSGRLDEAKSDSDIDCIRPFLLCDEHSVDLPNDDVLRNLCRCFQRPRYASLAYCNTCVDMTCIGV